MDKLRAMQAFVAIADAGSLTAASRALESSLPTTVRLLAALEAELGVRLVNRTTRRLSLTDAGRRYLERCREAQALIVEAEAEARAEQSQPVGKLRVTAPVLFGQRHVVRGIAAFVSRYPQVSVEVKLADRVINLVEEEVDVAVRIGRLADSSLIARDVGRMRRLTVAAPSYLARRGVPERPLQLLEHNCIRLRPGAGRSWTFRVKGKTWTLPVKGNLSVNQVAAAAEVCAAGLGIGNFFAYQVAAHLANGALSVLLAEYEVPPRPVSLVYPAARLLPARTRLFIDFMAEHIARESPSWQPSPARERAPRRTAG